MGFFISDEDKSKHCDRVEKHPSSGKYEGLNPERHSTDFIFFIAIFAMWICMSCVGGYAVRNCGDPYRLLGPINSEGKICVILMVTKQISIFILLQHREWVFVLNHVQLLIVP